MLSGMAGTILSFNWEGSEFMIFDCSPNKAAKNKIVNLLSVLLGTIVVCYSMLYFNNTYPISEGWGVNYAELVLHGKIPYRDFYYYLPPLNILIELIFWKLSFGSLLAFRGWYLLQRIVICILMFHLLSKVFKVHIAFGACVLTVFIGSGDLYDLIGDYNQTMVLLTVLLLYGTNQFVQSRNAMQRQLGLAVSGAVLGCMFLNKQTIFAAAFCVFWVVLTVLCVLNRDGDYWKYLLSVAGGIVLPLAVAAAYLLANGAFVSFVEQVFLNVDSKGSIFEILVVTWLGRLWNPMMIGAVFSGAALLIIDSKREDGRPPSKWGVVLLLLSVLAVICAISAQEMQDLWGVLVKHPFVIGAFGTCIATLILFIVCTGKMKCRSLQMSYCEKEAQIACVCAVVLAAIPAFSIDFAKELYLNTSIFRTIQEKLWLALMLASMVLLGFLLCQQRGKTDPQQRVRNEQLIFMNCGGIALLYSGAMATGNSAPPANSLRVALPLLLCVIGSLEMNHRNVSAVLKGSVSAICIVLAMSCVSQKVVCSYAWWGSYMYPEDEKICSTDIPAMAGIKVSPNHKELYETVVSVIENNVSDDAEIWGYPHIKLFNILTNRYNMDTFVPVLFYDVVSDRYVEKELELLNQHLPDVIIWEEIADCKEVHETLFRNGKPLKQRDIEEFLNKTIPEKYTWMVTIENVSVYILNSSLKLSTYDSSLLGEEMKEAY